MLELNDLGCFIGNTAILKNITFSAERGEFIAVIGANGAGKSTLLKCFCGMNSFSGSIKYSGAETASLSAAERAAVFGYMEQDNNPDFPFTVRELVAMGRYPHIGRLGRESACDKQIINSAMADTGTALLANRNFLKLSGGERQRVLFARVLSQQTPVLLLDEPVSALDVSCREKLFELMKNQAAAGKIVIATLHDLKEAARHCSRLIVLKQGRLLADGAPADILNNALIQSAYGLEAVVYYNRISGNVDYFIANNQVTDYEKKVHIVCGIGSGCETARFLLARGASISMGVLSEGDSDLEFAAHTGIDCIVEKPYTTISDAAYSENVGLIRQADLVILTSMPFGKQMLRNLEACQFARKLLILEDEDISNRDFSGGMAATLYNSLKPAATVIRSCELPSIL